MSAGAVFKLIANDGKADRMIMATKLINQRIKDVMCARQRLGKADITPTLSDLERTHILYVNSHFQPFAAIGSEYNKVRPQSGNPILGGGVTFSIPQFGDFFHDMVCRVRLSKFRSSVLSTPQQAIGTPTAHALFPLNGYDAAGTATDNVAYNIVDAAGNVVVAGSTTPAATASYRNYVRYCEFPGNRLFSLVKFDVNGNPLDQYDSVVPVMLEKFCTAPNKRTGYNRLVGQEVPITGYSGFTAATVTDADSGNTPTTISKVTDGQSNQTVGLFNGAANLAASTLASCALNASGALDISRKVVQYVNGPQTPKPEQPPLEIWNKLHFWFNDDVRLSVPSVSIPFGQRFISIDLASQNLLAYEVPSIFLETIVDNITDDSIPTGTTTNQRVKTYTPIFQPGTIETISISKMELYINNIFVNPEIHDIYIKRIGFSLIRVYRQHTQRCNADSSDEKLLSQLKWPIEYMFVGLRPSWNIRDVTISGATISGNQNQWRDWHRMTRQVDAAADCPFRAEMPYASGTTARSKALLGSSIGQVQPDRYYLDVPSVDTLTLTSHGITIFDTFNDTFFNQYMPYHYGGAAIVTPEDTGALFVNMALFPGSNQPSGHLNISRARETYFKWTTSYASSNTPCDLLAVAKAINFLLVTDGSAVLRYST